MVKWEYKVIYIDAITEERDAKALEKLLNQYGVEGWELVSVLDQVYSGFGVQPRVYGNSIMFKRGCVQ